MTKYERFKETVTTILQYVWLVTDLSMRTLLVIIVVAGIQGSSKQLWTTLLGFFWIMYPVFKDVNRYIERTTLKKMLERRNGKKDS